MLINDISKVTGLEINIIKNILINSDFPENNLEELVEKNFFKDNNYRKISKKLIIDIAKARIEELSELIIFKNINTKFFLEKKTPIFLKINNSLIFQKFSNSFKFFFSKKDNCSFNIIDNGENENFLIMQMILLNLGGKERPSQLSKKKGQYWQDYSIFYLIRFCFF